MDFILRHAKKTIERFSKEFPTVLLTGARQTGKSTLLKKICEPGSIQSLSFDDPMEEISAKNDPKTFLEFHKAPFMFDEIQYVPEIFRYLKIKIDENRKNGMYFLTGSQQFNLMQNASESLAGRIGILQLYPLSAREIRNDSFSDCFVPTKEYILSRSNSFSNYKFSIEKTWNKIFNGGYPEIIKSEIEHSDFYSNYLKTYIERDIRKLTQVADELQFLQLITAAASRTGQLLNYSDIAKDVGISEITAKKWISLLLTSGLVYLLQPFSKNVEKRIIKTPKLYFMDTGLAAYLTKWTNPEILQNGAMSGAFFESYVISEIIKSFTNNGIEPPVYFYRDKDKTEIDLLIFQNNTVFPIEIKKTASPKQDSAKNFFITNRFSNVKIGQKTVICNCEKPVMLENEAIAIPVEYV